MSPRPLHPPIRLHLCSPLPTTLLTTPSTWTLEAGHPPQPLQEGGPGPSSLQKSPSGDKCSGPPPSLAPCALQLASLVIVIGDRERPEDRGHACPAPQVVGPLLWSRKEGPRGLPVSIGTGSPPAAGPLSCPARSPTGRGWPLPSGTGRLGEVPACRQLPGRIMVPTRLPSQAAAARQRWLRAGADGGQPPAPASLSSPTLPSSLKGKET